MQNRSQIIVVSSSTSSKKLLFYFVLSLNYPQKDWSNIHVQKVHKDSANNDAKHKYAADL